MKNETIKNINQEISLRTSQINAAKADLERANDSVDKHTGRIKDLELDLIELDKLKKHVEEYKG